MTAVAVAMALYRPAPLRVAFANSMSGASAPAGRESLVATRIVVDEVNARGGVGGRPLELVVFDDASSTDTARANVARIASGGSLAVLGHFLSSASLAAGPAYRDARIPALSASASVDELTADNPYYFRAVTPVSAQARSIGEYLRAVMKEPRVRLVHTRDAYGSSFVRGFSDAYPATQTLVAAVDVAGGRIGGVEDMLAALDGDAGPGVIVIAAAADSIADIVKALRRHKIASTIIVPQGAAREDYLRNFANEPEEKARAGFFSDSLYAAAPIIFDSAGAQAQAFAGAFTKVAGTAPSWVAAGAHDAARLMIAALERSGIARRSDGIAADRERLRAALAAIDDPETAVAGLTGPLYFNAGRDMPRPGRLGFFRRGRFVTAPVQLVPIDRPEGIDMAAQREQGHVVSFDTRHYWVQHVVYTGIDIDRLNRIDIKAGTFSAELHLWMRFAGDDDGETRIAFPSLLDHAAFDPARPVQAGQDDGLTYRLYRISGDFKARYDLHDYPFDTQHLTLNFRNTDQRQELITYVIDRFGLRLADEAVTTAEDDTFSALPSWRFEALRYFADQLSTRSTRGRAAAIRVQASTGYAGFDATISMRRRSTLFLLKNLLPLLLLVFVVFTTLFFPATLFRERVTIPVTSILTSAVLLVAVNSQIGDVGYTVVLEEMFYVFFALCLFSMLTGFVHERLQQAHRDRFGALVDLGARLIYAGTVVGVAGVLYWRYAA